ncbi:MAG TPA: hypothetical protein VFB08_04550 [Burkholderiales bacterium]|nr:hypothetical protein [Burkholderiales bacterium]
MREALPLAALRRAAAICGSVSALAALCDLAPDDLRGMLEGRERVAPHVFMRAVDLIVEEDLRRLKRPPPIS